MIKKYFLLLVALPAFSFAQDKDEELIQWNAPKQLTWDDYKANPDPHSDAAASTTTYLGIEYNMEGNVFAWKIQCSFSKTKSWARSKTDFILKHEQGHFDIAEIFARKLNERMSGYKFNKDSYKTDLKNIYQAITNEKEELQNQYDKETDHSRKKEEQLNWLKKINKMLEELKDFSGY
jgi:parvulin-like peptidyl-prolyl isomerase